VSAYPPGEGPADYHCPDCGERDDLGPCDCERARDAAARNWLDRLKDDERTPR
jgi:hypothetical protein